MSKQLKATQSNSKLLILLTFILCFNLSFSQNNNTETFDGHEYVLVNNQWNLFLGGKLFINDNHLYIKSYSMTQQNINFLENEYKINHIKTFFTSFYVFSIDSSYQLLSIAKQIDTLPYINLLEIGVYGKYHSNPNDTYYNPTLGTGQWYLYTGNGMGVDSAWTITTGDSNIIVMVIDNGINYNHPDLGMGADGYENIYKNHGEDPWTGVLDTITGNKAGNGIDDDGNGEIDDWKGWNYHVNYPTGTKNANYYPDIYRKPGSHGVPVSGIIAAKTNNGIGVSGIAGGWGNKGVRILPINQGPMPGMSLRAVLGIEYAIKMDVDIINMSFSTGSIIKNALLDSAIINAYNHGISVVSSAGNDGQDTNRYFYNVQFPANSKYVIGVGAHSFSGNKEPYSCYGKSLDIAAPTVARTTSRAGGYENFPGTSAAAPQVAGVVALMKSINPCISPGEISEIIKSTAIKSGGYNYNWNPSKPGHSKELGYGRINAFEAVKLAQSYKSNSLDLYMKDDEKDFGFEPNNNSTRFYLSPDIWVRNQNDGLDNWEHQNPEYDPVVPVYVNIRIRNKSCDTSTGNEKLFLHWSKAGTNLGFPNSWNGSTGSPVLGDLIDSISIPIIPAGRDVILSIPWVIPNPTNYTSVGSNMWHFCLLARIKSSVDTMFTVETAPGNFIKANNNIVMKNLTVIDSMFSTGGGGSSIGSYSGTISVGNISNVSETYDIKFFSDENGANGILNFYDILLEVDADLNQKIISSNENNGIEFLEDNKILISENDFMLNSINFNPNELNTLNLTFLRKVDFEPTQKEFHYHINQINSEDNSIIGGELFIVKTTNENLSIDANAGNDVTATSDETVNIEADLIPGNVDYKWYDEDGNLISEEREFDVVSDSSTTYQLKVFDIENGLTDEDYINITVDDNEIESISPNPTTNQIVVTYNNDNANNSYIMIVENNVIHNYLINNSNTITIQVGNFSTGTHTIILVCDGLIKDVKNFVKI